MIDKHLTQKMEKLNALAGPRGKNAVPRDRLKTPKSKKIAFAGNRPFGGAFYLCHRRDPPPVQAAGDTIPKGLHSSEWRPFFGRDVPLLLAFHQKREPAWKAIGVLTASRVERAVYVMGFS